jgi:membrane-associated protein
MLQHLDINAWVTQIGFIGLLLVIFVETGLFVGFFLPGDSLVIASGFLAAGGLFNIWILIPSLIAAAILGYALAYWFGKVLGTWLLERKDGWFFKRRHITEAAEFYDKHGGMALVLGRFIPIVRTFVPIVAGMAKMSYARYMFFNVLGAFLWGGVLCVVGYTLGRFVPDGEHYFFPIILFVVAVSMIPLAWHVFCGARKKRRPAPNK